MSAHRSFERFEQGQRVSEQGTEDAGPNHARNAALAVAVMAALLAVATFLSNEAVKHVITGETHGAETSAELENNLLKIEVANGDAVLLRVLAEGGPEEHRAATSAQLREGHVRRELRPAGARLDGEIESYRDETSHANTQHTLYELAEVGLEVAIVLATVSIIARRRWLLGAGGAAASAGIVLLLLGLLS